MFGPIHACLNPPLSTSGTISESAAVGFAGAEPPVLSVDILDETCSPFLMQTLLEKLIKA